MPLKKYKDFDVIITGSWNKLELSSVEQKYGLKEGRKIPEGQPNS